MFGHFGAGDLASKSINRPRVGSGGSANQKRLCHWFTQRLCGTLRSEVRMQRNDKNAARQSTSRANSRFTQPTQLLDQNEGNQDKVLRVAFCVGEAIRKLLANRIVVNRKS